MHKDRNALPSILALAFSVCGAILVLPTQAAAHFVSEWGIVLDEYNRQIGRNVSCTEASYTPGNTDPAADPAGWTPLFAGIDEYNSRVARNVPCSASQVSFPSGHIASAPGRWAPLFAGIDG